MQLREKLSNIFNTLSGKNGRKARNESRLALSMATLGVLGGIFGAATGGITIALPLAMTGAMIAAARATTAHFCSKTYRNNSL